MNNEIDELNKARLALHPDDSVNIQRIDNVINAYKNVIIQLDIYMNDNTMLYPERIAYKKAIEIIKGECNGRD